MKQDLTPRQEGRLIRAYNALASLHGAAERAQQKIDKILTMESPADCSHDFASEHCVGDNDSISSYEEALAEIKTGALGASCSLDSAFERIADFMNAAWAEGGAA